MKNKVVIYTAIFGGKDNLIEPEFIPEGCDFVCFTDSDFVSGVWEVRKVKPEFEDPNRSAKIYKILPHKYFPEYEISIWIDGNMLVKGDVSELIKKYLKDVNFSAFDHTPYRKFWKKFFPLKFEEYRDCVYDEARFILELGKKRVKYKDDPELIKFQIEKYRKENYPKHSGLIVGMVLLRRHNEEDVIQTMEAWWQEIQNGSCRDQLSFNYVAWKNNFNFCYIEQSSRKNRWFLHTQHRLK
ncbi:MAG: glycosyltransferase domain-containing protein [Patescibacteria group bacterium]